MDVQNSGNLFIFFIKYQMLDKKNVCTVGQFFKHFLCVDDKKGIGENLGWIRKLVRPDQDISFF